ncbi:MAG: hypothetical protein RL330_619 [Actinomycetota bacterium]
MNERSSAGIVFVLVSGASFGLLPWFARTAYDHGADPLGMLTARFTTAAVCLVALRLLVHRGEAWPERGLLLRLLALGSVGYAIQSSFYFYGVERLDVSLGTVIFYTYPVMVVLAGWAIFGRRPSGRMATCLAVVVIGAALTAGQVKSGSWIGVAAMLAAAGWYTGYILASSRITHRAGALTSLTVVMVGASMAHIVMWPLHRSALPQDATGWAAAVGAAVVSTIIAMGFFFAGVARMDAGEAAVLSTIEPVVSIVVGVAALGETVNAPKVAGAVAVLAGVAVLAHFSRASRVAARS